MTKMLLFKHGKLMHDSHTIVHEGFAGDAEILCLQSGGLNLITIALCLQSGRLNLITISRK